MFVIILSNIFFAYFLFNNLTTQNKKNNIWNTEISQAIDFSIINGHLRWQHKWNSSHARGSETSTS